MALAGPTEVLELQDQESTAFRVVRFEEGECEIDTRHGAGMKVVSCLRVHVATGDKPFFPFYWDITSKRLTAQLKPLLENPQTKGRRFRVTAHGVAPKKWFALEVT